LVAPSGGVTAAGFSAFASRGASRADSAEHLVHSRGNLPLLRSHASEDASPPNSHVMQYLIMRCCLAFKPATKSIAVGVKAKITCVDPAKLARSFAGGEYDLSLLQALPPGIDPCGENGEFHTFVYDAPVFFRPIEVRTGVVVERDGFVFADLLS
jgi:hypothetical protein